MKTIIHMDVRRKDLQSFILPQNKVEVYSFDFGIRYGFLSTQKIQAVGLKFLNPSKLIS
jgi:hypothetical protein